MHRMKKWCSYSKCLHLPLVDLDIVLDTSFVLTQTCANQHTHRERNHILINLRVLLTYLVISRIYSNI